MPILISKKAKRKLELQRSIFSWRFTCGCGNTKCAVALPRMLLHTFGIGFRRITSILLGILSHCKNPQGSPQHSPCLLGLCQSCPSPREMARLHASAHHSLPTILLQGLVFVEARNWQASPPTERKHYHFWRHCNVYKNWHQQQHWPDYKIPFWNLG